MVSLWGQLTWDKQQATGNMESRDSVKEGNATDIIGHGLRRFGSNSQLTFRPLVPSQHGACPLHGMVAQPPPTPRRRHHYHHHHRSAPPPPPPSPPLLVYGKDFGGGLATHSTRTLPFLEEGMMLRTYLASLPSISIGRCLRDHASALVCSMLCCSASIRS